ncbi:MAG TPA: ferritin-like domain-containing protein [Kofleriaceae bacterium]|jgi:hypothetical protein
MIAIPYIIGGCIIFLASLLLVSAIKAPKVAPKDAEIPPAQVVVKGQSPHASSEPRRQKRSVVPRVFGSLVLGGIGAGVIALWYGITHLDLGGSKGRILRLNGKAALPQRTTGTAWSDATSVNVQHLSKQQRATLAELWTISAQMEHASVPAFGQLSLHLAALGAPSELVERTHIAALDEIRHARRCYAIASAYAGTAISAGPIVELQMVHESTIDPIRLAIGTLVDGCVAEGVAAEVARTASESATDPTIKEALAMIARDERTHAELGWSVLEWCIEQRGVRAALASRVAKLDEQLAPKLPELTAFSADQLAAHGVLSQQQIGDIAAATIVAARARAQMLLAHDLQLAA